MLNEKFRYARDISMSGTATGSRTGTASNAGRMSVMSATNTSTGLMQQN